MLGVLEQETEQITRVQVPVRRFVDRIFPWQYQTLRAFDEGRARFMMCECHRRSRKTTLAINLLIREAMTHPNASYFYMGPTYTQAKLTVWSDPNMLFSYLPDRETCPWEKNESELYIRFPNKAMLHILGGDKPDSLRGPDWQGGDLDEWALMKENIWTEILRPVIAQDLYRWVMFGYTTKGMNHAAMQFDLQGGIESQLELPACGPTLNPKEGWYCTRLDAEVSGIIPRAELAKAKAEMPTWLYDQEFRCARITAEERALITSLLLDSCGEVYIPELENRKIISCDPSEGNDEIVIMCFENHKLLEPPTIMHRRDIEDNTILISKHMENKGYQHDCKNFIVDAIGIGKPIADDLRLATDDEGQVRYYVQLFKGNESALESERFHDRNMEAVWHTANEMSKGTVDFIEDRETKRQLPMLRCQANLKGQLQLDNSNKIKKDCGCSPDRAKCFVQGIYGLRNIEPEKSPQKERLGYSRMTDRPESPMVM